MPILQEPSSLPFGLPDHWDEQVDVLVVGSGFTGICAGIELLKAGCRVAVLEKMPTAGGNSIIDSGELSVVDSPQQKRRRVRDSAGLLAQDILVNGEFMNDARKVRYIAEHAYDIYMWTRELGVEWTEGVARAGGHSVPRIVVTHTGSGSEIYACLARHYTSLGGTVRLSHYVERLYRDPLTGRVLGVRVRVGYTFPDEFSGRPVNIRAEKAVILCHGGFAADIAYRQEKNSLLTADLGTTNQPGATGELWREAERIGCLMSDRVGAVHAVEQSERRRPGDRVDLFRVRCGEFRPVGQPEGTPFRQRNVQPQNPNPRHF